MVEMLLDLDQRKTRKTRANNDDPLKGNATSPKRGQGPSSTIWRRNSTFPLQPLTCPDFSACLLLCQERGAPHIRKLSRQ